MVGRETGEKGGRKEMAYVLECRRSAGRLAGFRLLSARRRHDRLPCSQPKDDSDGVMGDVVDAAQSSDYLIDSIRCNWRITGSFLFAAKTAACHVS